MSEFVEIRDFLAHKKEDAFRHLVKDLEVDVAPAPRELSIMEKLLGATPEVVAAERVKVGDSLDHVRNTFDLKEAKIKSGHKLARDHDRFNRATQRIDAGKALDAEAVAALRDLQPDHEAALHKTAKSLRAIGSEGFRETVENSLEKVSGKVDRFQDAIIALGEEGIDHKAQLAKFGIDLDAHAGGDVELSFGDKKGKLGTIVKEGEKNVYKPAANLTEVATDAGSHFTEVATHGRESVEGMAKASQQLASEVEKVDATRQRIQKDVLKNEKAAPIVSKIMSGSNSGAPAIGTKGRIAGGTAAFEQMGHMEAAGARISANYHQSGVLEKGVRGGVAAVGAYIGLNGIYKMVKGKDTDAAGNEVEVNYTAELLKTTAAAAAVATALMYGGKNRATHGSWSLGA